VVCLKSRNEPQIFGQIHFLFFLPAVGFYGFAQGAKPECRAAKPRGNPFPKQRKLRLVDPGESNPRPIHAMDVCYRYTTGPCFQLKSYYKFY
jgi:hypothetical protein